MRKALQAMLCMAAHYSSDWLHVFHKNTDWFVTCGDGLNKAISSLNDPHTQCPSTVLLVGRQEKETAQRAMFLGQRLPKSRGLVQLHAEASTLDNDHPLFIASLNIETAYSRFQPPRRCSKETSHKVEWLSEQSPANATLLVDTVISRIILLFTDVVCLFLDDFPTPDDAICLLHRWAEACRFIQPWKPRVILVASRGSMDKSMLSTSVFGDALHVKLKSYNTSHPRSHRHRALKALVLQSVEAVQKRKTDCKRLFSAKHLNALFKSALKHIASQVLPEFDIVRATRQGNEVDQQFTHHLETFLGLCVATNASRDFVVRYLASAIILDSLPPGMHRKSLPCSKQPLLT
jgi:hypothetical protein